MNYTINMDLEILRIVVWPVLILIVIIIFRKRLDEMIRNVSDFSITKDGFSAKVGRLEPVATKQSRESSQEDANVEYFVNDKEGEVLFDYSNNNGVFTIGEGEYRFDTKWSKASREYIHFYNDQPTIKSIRLAKDSSSLEEVKPEKYDSSSRARTAGIGQIAIFENTHGKFLAIKVLALKDDSRGDTHDEIRFTYKILT